MRDLTARTLALIIFGAFIFGLIVFGVRQCEQRRSLSAQKRVDAAQGTAKNASAADAVNTVAHAGEREAASETLTRTNEQEIRNAEGANVQVGAGVDAAGRRALCLRSAYRNDPKCRMLKPDPK